MAEKHFCQILLVAMLLMWSFHLSPVCLRPAGYATRKNSWIPDSEREKLIPVLPRAPTALYPVILIIFHLLNSLFPAATNAAGPRTWAPQPRHLSVTSLTPLHGSTDTLEVKCDNSSQILSSGPSPPHWRYSSPAGWGPGHMATGGHVPEIDVLVNLQQVRGGLFF